MVLRPCRGTPRDQQGVGRCHGAANLGAEPVTVVGKWADDAGQAAVAGDQGDKHHGVHIGEPASLGAGPGRE